MTSVRPASASSFAWVGLACVVATIGYSGAVTTFALAAFVLPSMVAAAVVTALVARSSPSGALLAGIVTGLVLAEVVNLASGDSNGPAARSSFAAASFTALAVALVAGPAPGLFAVGVLGVLAAALALGAGAEVGPVAVATAVVCVVVLAFVESGRRGWVGRAPGRLTVLVLAGLVGGVVTVVAMQVQRGLGGDPYVVSPKAVDASIKPQFAGLPSSSASPVRSAPSPPARARPSAMEGSKDSGGDGWAILAVVALVAMLLIAFRLLWVWLAWRWLRRRLRRGTPQERVAGAWVWAYQRLASAGWAMSPALSPDGVAFGHRATGLPRAARSDLRRVAESTVAAIYAPPVTVTEADCDEAWRAADKVGRIAVASLGPSRRVGFVLRPVSSTPSHSGARGTHADGETGT